MPIPCATPKNSCLAATVRTLISVLIIVLFLPLVANSSDDDSLRVERLYSLSKLWGPITYFHPYLAYKPINFDSAFAVAAIKIDTASSREEYVNAIADMLSCLDDPITRVVPDPSMPTSSECEGEALETEWTKDSVLTITINENCLADYMAAFGCLERVVPLIAEANGVIFDVRLQTANELNFRVGLALIDEIVPSLISSTVYLPGKRSRMYDGFPDETGEYSAFYTSSFSIVDGRELKPAVESAGCRTIFIINEFSPLPLGAYSMQNAGMAAILTVGQAVDAGVDTYDISLADNVQVSIRTSEIVHPDGTVGLQPNKTVLASATSEVILQTATKLLEGGEAANPSRETTPIVGRLLGTKDRYSEPAYPNLGYRILAAAKIHYVIDNFFAYTDLMDEDWDGILKTFIPRLAAARDSLEYALTAAEMYKYTDDGHCVIIGETLRFFYGPSAPPLLIRPIEGRSVITGLLDDSVCHAAGVEVGDVIKEIDGVDALKLLDSLKRYRAASNPNALDRYVTHLGVRGPDSSIINLTVEGKDNQIRTVRLPRLDRFRSLLSNTERFGSDTIQILDGNIGYVDLDRLSSDHVPVVYDSLKDARAIIFDMRGYPRGGGFFVTSRLASEPNIPMARFENPVVFPPTTLDDGTRHGVRKFFTQTNLPSSGPRYEGLTVMLIDSRTQSSAEHLGLHLEASNGTKFIGTQSAGANGNVTGFFIPGGLRLGFTGLDTRHADGRQLQRIGLVPDIEVKPTIEGIRAGRDEILDAAIKYVNETLAGQ